VFTFVSLNVRRSFIICQTIDVKRHFIFGRLTKSYFYGIKF
jgi:hypothetical protein